MSISTTTVSSETSKRKNYINITDQDIEHIMDRYHYNDETQHNILNENLLPSGLLSRLHNSYPQHSGIMESTDFMFTGKERYSGLNGFREIVSVLNKNGIDIGYIEQRELFINVYRFLATKHVLNKINWKNFAKDSLFQLVFPQPGMINPELFEAYQKAENEEAKDKLIKDYIKKTNPHDGKQLLNKPWYEHDEGELEILKGSQHKYPQVQLIFDASTQNCFSFCTYCFRHAQVRGDEDMFVQKDINQVIEYLKKHKEVTDVLITGGDAGYITYNRLEAYTLPIIEDPELMHIKTLRMGTRVLTYQPEMILSSNYDKYLKLFRKLNDNGLQVLLMSHFSTPREVLNPSTIAAIRRLKNHGVAIKSQSPVMHHISLFSDENGKIDIDKSAQNWIDLGNVLATLSVGFHSMYCARPTGEHHYFTVPLTIINQVFSKVYRSLPSIARPSRYITMTSSAGKISMLGEVMVNGEKAFALKFNESRNMEWMDKVFLAKYDEHENTIANLKPLYGDKHFYEDELDKIELALDATLRRKMEA
ncbi:MAG: hypothetical protein PHG67_11025 [Bacteroidales bacterium]|nr:hypothetical protein [Bacteroidales bacterium]HOI33027.1 hypothetical protein [Bacteroidales bacterium]